MYYNTLENIGIVYVAQKKTLQKDGKTINYYEIIDCACGYIYSYRNIGIQFTSLSTNIGNTLCMNFNPESKFLALKFKSFNELASKNNNINDIEKFLSEYKKHIGKQYLYNGD